MSANTQQPQQLNIQLGEKEAEGTYANLAIISHSPAEFIIDFTRVLPGVPKTKVYSRIIMTPQHAKSFMNALNENIAKYEEQFGEVKVVNEHGKANKSIGFQPPLENEPRNGE